MHGICACENLGSSGLKPQIVFQIFRSESTFILHSGFNCTCLLDPDSVLVCEFSNLSPNAALKCQPSSFIKILNSKVSCGELYNLGFPTQMSDSLYNQSM